ncbi:MAG TPA: TrmH family RNA methyltransferase [Candidatus Limnocylindrales bacterium]|nr:TrmH family RNA methyltransferase [Candidatus Limnocylindrales bacterium]
MPSPALPILTSLANPRIKSAAALRDRRERDRTGLTLVDGAREVRRAIDAGADLVEVFVCEPLLAGPDARAALDGLRGRDIAIQATSEAVFAKLAFGERSEGLVAIVRIPQLGLDGIGLPDDPLVAVVEGVEKPGNLGAILRSADGAAVDAVVAASPRTDLFNPNAIRSSAGTIFSVGLAAADSADVLAWLRDRGIRIVAARVDAVELYTEVDLTGPLALVVGAEAAGLGDAWSAADIVAVHLPMLGVADSLNVSVSAAILFYEARRQRGEPARTTRG